MLVSKSTGLASPLTPKSATPFKKSRRDNFPIMLSSFFIAAGIFLAYSQLAGLSVRLDGGKDSGDAPSERFGVFPISSSSVPPLAMSA